MKERWLYLVATCGGIGYARIAPGTFATAAALPLHWALELLPAALHFAVAIAVTAAAVWVAGRVCRALAAHDPQIVVIDEMAGALLALWLVGDLGLAWELGAAVLFRLLDIAKPWPLRRLEACRPEGVGVVADDVAAGVIAGLAARLLGSL